MVSNPDALLAEYAAAGSDIITVHAEACPHLDRSLSHIHELGCKAGVSVNPHTPIDGLQHVLDRLDLILVMTVNPGFGGQKLYQCYDRQDCRHQSDDWSSSDHH
jgi:ribulose-phosphate 3-epimerase